MRTNTLGIALAVTLAAASGCASTQRPVLYPNATLTRVGEPQAERDIDDCMSRAESHGLTATGETKVVRRGRGRGGRCGGRGGRSRGLWW